MQNLYLLLECHSLFVAYLVLKFYHINIAFDIWLYLLCEKHSEINNFLGGRKYSFYANLNSFYAEKKNL